jgi:ABC-type Fe3+ transport system, periplasmic component
MAAATEGLLEKYISDEAKNIPDGYKDKDGYWTGMSIVTAGLVVNNNVCKEKNIPIPQTWAELTDSKYKNEILMPNPNISGTSYCIISSLLQTWGNDKGWKYFEDLNKNISYYPQRGGEPPQKAIAGEVAIAIAPLDGEQIENGKGKNVTNVFPKDGIPWTPAPVAIFKGAENMEVAKKFVDWSLSKKGQEIIVKACPRVPVRSDVATPEVMKDVKSSDLLKTDIFKAGKDRDKILKLWKEKIKK